MLEKTFFMVKPDGVSRGLEKEIFKRVKQAGLKVVQKKKLRMTEKQAAELYSPHLGKSFYPGLINFITCGEVICSVVEGENAILCLRDLMGVTDPREAASGTIRGDLKEKNVLNAEGIIKNLVHGSDSPESARREIGVFFRPKSGIQTLLFVLLFLSLGMSFVPVQAQEGGIPEKQNTVTDYYGRVNAETKIQVEDLADELRRVTSVNLEVLVIRSTLPLDADAYGRRIYDEWDVGRKEKGLEHGVLLLVAILDREVRIIAGEGVEYILTPKVREEIQWGMFPSLGRGEISKSVLIGSTAISRLILEEWPRYEKRKESRVDMRLLPFVLFSLVLAAFLLALIFGKDFLTMFGTVVGGLFGYFLLGIFGAVVGAAVGFLINVWTARKGESEAERAARRIYEEWKAGRKKPEGGARKPGSEEQGGRK